MTEIRSKSTSPAETQAFAARVAAAAGPHAFYALRGDLGAGKTCFVQGLCSALGIKALVSSPTFAIANEYRADSATALARRFLHLDLYRLSGPQELDSIGWYDYVESLDSMAVEWPERAGDELPERTVFVDFLIGPGEDEREIVARIP